MCNSNLFGSIQWPLAAFGILAMVEGLEAQQETRDSRTGEAAAESKARQRIPSRYNVRLGSAGLNFSAGLRAEYLDNVYLTERNEKDDFILVPQFNAGAFLPIGQLNVLSVDLGLAYYQYLNNTELNTGSPVVNPNSELVFNIYSGDVAVRLSEAFSYQETPFHEYGGQFFNVHDTGLFARYDNRVGAAATWDLHDLVVDGSYYHENLIANGSTFNYIDHASELFSLKAMLAVMPPLSVGLESTGSLNSFDNKPLSDHWRAGVGPAAQLRLTQYIRARLGAGYQRIEYDSPEATATGLDGFNTFYSYASATHIINAYISHSLEVSHDNQLGINAANLEGTHINYSVTWKPNEKLTIFPYCAVNWYKEYYDSGRRDLYNESFNYISSGIGGEYKFDPHWQLNLRYDYRLKDSDTPDNGYTQNRVVLAVTYHF